MATLADVRHVLESYAEQFQPLEIESLGSAGGLSGAQIWRLHTRKGVLCLRRWPFEQPSPKKLTFIHAVLRHVWQAGFHLVPPPIFPTYTQHPQQQCYYVRHDRHLWELTHWLPGVADYRQAPSETKLRGALTALASFHRAAESFPKTKAALVSSPGIADRLTRLRQLLAGDFEKLASQIQTGSWPEFALLARQLMDLFPRAAPQILSQLTEAMKLLVPLQPCIRDIWHPHVLFEGDRVSGLIDFGAMRVENVATDVARLLGSMVGDEPQGRQLGMDAYTQIRPLSAAELRLVEVFDVSATLLGGINWVQWVYQEERQFDNHDAVLGRLGELVRRLVPCQSLKFGL